MATYEITKAIEEAIGICKETGKASVDLGKRYCYICRVD